MEQEKSILETLPHICQRICLIWGTAELDIYLNGLILDSRDGARKGLPQPVLAELSWVQELNKRRRALDLQEELKISFQAALEKVEAIDDSARPTDVWGGAIAPGANTPTPARRYSDKAKTERPHRRREENTLFGIVFAGVAGIMVYISLDELLPTAERYGEHHLAIYGVISGMVVMAVSLLLFA